MQLGTAGDQLERKLAQRTGELARMNEQLCYEIGERQAAEEQLRYLAQAVEQSSATILIADVHGTVEYVNAAFTRTTGYTMEEVVGKEASLLRGTAVQEDAFDEVTRKLAAGEVWQGDISGRHKNGTQYWQFATISAIRTDGIITHFITVGEDNTERGRARAAMLQSRAELEARVEERTADLARANAELRRQVDERVRAEMAARRHVERLAALRSIDAAITGSLDLRVTGNVLLDQVTAQLGVDGAALLLFNLDLQEMELRASRGLRGGSAARQRVRLGEGVAGRAAILRRVVAIGDLGEDEAQVERAKLLDAEDFVAYVAAPLLAKGQLKGVLEVFHRAALRLDPEWLQLLEAFAAQAAIAVDNANLFEELQRSNLDLVLAYDATIEGWSRTLDLRDRETEGHSQRVTEMTLQLARAVGLGPSELVHVRRGALLHDIGKMGIPDSILLKPEPLTEEEWVVMRRHPVYAFELLSPIGYLSQALDIPYCHHEKWDGSGYPRGLRGEAIPLAARMFALADVWDALSSDRPYRSAWPTERVREHVSAGAGKHFDPKMVEAFWTVV